MTPAISKVVQDVIGLPSSMEDELEAFLGNQSSMHTSRCYSTAIRDFLTYLGEDNPTLTVLVNYRNHLINKAGLTKRSANTKLSAIKSFMAFLHERGKTSENQSIFLKGFKGQSVSPTLALTDQEATNMIFAVWNSLRDLLMLQMLMYLGLRREELVNIKLSDFYVQVFKGTAIMGVTVTGKGNKQRVLPLNDDVLQTLNLYTASIGRNIGENNYLFASTSGCTKPMTVNNVYAIVKKCALKAGITKSITPHSLRATAISNALENGASHKSIQEMAGWNTPLMIQHYDKRNTKLNNSAVFLVDYEEKDE